jgi:hypothetical protein
MAQAPKPRPKQKPKPKFTDKKQSERFIEAARELGIENGGEIFDRVFTKVVPPKLASGRRQKDES